MTSGKVVTTASTQWVTRSDDRASLFYFGSLFFPFLSHLFLPGLTSKCQDGSLVNATVMPIPFSLFALEKGCDWPGLDSKGKDSHTRGEKKKENSLKWVCANWNEFSELVWLLAATPLPVVWRPSINQLLTSCTHQLTSVQRTERDSVRWDHLRLSVHYGSNIQTPGRVQPLAEPLPPFRWYRDFVYFHESVSERLRKPPIYACPSRSINNS